MMDDMILPERLDPTDEDVPIGEVVSLPRSFIVDRLARVAEPMEYVSHGRMVGHIQDVDGVIYRTGLDEVEARPSDEVEGHYDVKLKSRKNKIILAAGASILLAAGTGAALQFNRTHRKKSRR